MTELPDQVSSCELLHWLIFLLSMYDHVSYLLHKINYILKFWHVLVLKSSEYTLVIPDDNNLGQNMLDRAQMSVA